MKTANLLLSLVASCAAMSPTLAADDTDAAATDAAADKVRAAGMEEVVVTAPQPLRIAMDEVVMTAPRPLSMAPTDIAVRLPRPKVVLARLDDDVEPASD